MQYPVMSTGNDLSYLRLTWGVTCNAYVWIASASRSFIPLHPRPCFSTICLTVDPYHFPMPERVGIPSSFHRRAFSFQLTPFADRFLAWRIRAATRLGGSLAGVSESATAPSPVGLSVD